jgi:DNA-binding CsgD family transcriptional regulator/tetratricopeptide (TPR) repeat protein
MAPAELIGREPVLEQARSWIDMLASGSSGLRITGKPGIGKTSVWSAAIELAALSGARVLATRPVEAELLLGHAGLGDVLGPVAAEVLTHLPEPQSRALAAALSLDAEPEPSDPLLVGRATVSALRLLADKSPVVIAVDDAEWLDLASVRALAFAVRRVRDLPVGFAVSIRSGHADPLGLADAIGDRLVEIELAGLSLGALGRLLRARADPDIARHSLVRIHARSAGNPFFALQLARAGDGSLPQTLTELVKRQLAIVAAVGQPVIEQVAVLGPLPLSAFVESAGLDAGVRAGLLVEAGGEVRFAHPLLAAGAYEQIPPGRRRALHGTAARKAGSVEERARHLALAATSPDARTAGILESAARTARGRGAPETAVELVGQAIRLTPPTDAEDRDRRTMTQADYLLLAADEPSARVLVDQLLAGPTRGTTRIRALSMRGLLETDPVAAVSRLEAAVAEPNDDPALAARALTQLAWQRGAWLGNLEPALVEARSALRAAEAIPDPSTLVAALTTTGLLSSLAGRPGAADYFRRALEITEREPRAAGDHSPRVAFAHERWWRGEFAEAAQLLDGERTLAEQHGDEGSLIRLNVFGAVLATYRGQWDEAAQLLEGALLDATGYWRMLALLHRGILRGRRGDRRAREDAVEVEASPIARSDPVFAAGAAFVFGLVDLDSGDVASAAERMADLPEVNDRSGARGADYAVLIPETVGLLVEADRPSRAEALVEQLERRHAQLEPWGTAAEALCHGLLALGSNDLPAAGLRFVAAREGFEALGAPWEFGQTLFAQGRLLRRLGRRLEAAGCLERAVEVFTGLGAEPAARRAADELHRARPRPRRDDSLTTAETRVAALVAAGRTNREVAAGLFTTVATVEAHLTRIYAKLGIRSRTELARLVSDGSVEVQDVRTD